MWGQFAALAGSAITSGNAAGTDPTPSPDNVQSAVDGNTTVSPSVYGAQTSGGGATFDPVAIGIIALVSIAVLAIAKK